jgi:hypothetical protein
MQVLKSRTSRALRAAGAHGGKLWQAGYYDHCLRDGEDLLKQARYILENPLRAGIVDRPEAYPFNWSIWGRTPKSRPMVGSHSPFARSRPWVGSTG